MSETESGVTQESLGSLHPREIDLLYRIRTQYRYGELVIETADGLPRRIVKTAVYEKLG